jgi:transcriptional regulator with XRE-family HTH domain
VAVLVGKAIRKARGPVTQSDFAEACGIRQAMISRYEAGKQVPSLDNLIRIVDAVKGNIDDFTREARAYIRKNDLGKPAPVKVSKPKPVKKPDKLAKKAAAKAAALDAPDKPKRSHTKKVAPTASECFDTPSPTVKAALTESAPAEVVNE